MSTQSLALPPGVGLAWAKVPLIGPSEEPDALPRYRKWPSRVRWFWEEFLKLPQNQAETRFKFRVWEVAQILGMSVRYVFAAMKWFKDHDIAVRYYG
jgi:hypothetical protein